jgi:hypothetical protein
VLRYLAVAHYGRGRGEWSASEYPPFWRDAVASAIARDDLAPTVALRHRDDCDAERLAAAWKAKLATIVLAVLEALYPAATADALPRARRSAENAATAG